MSKLLIVDDDDIILKIITVQLSQKHEILCASNGITALEILEEVKDIDLVITDINMPHMNGIELIKKIVSGAYKVQIIVMTSFDSPLIKNMVNQKGFSYLVKPFSMEKLGQVVEENLNDNFSANLMHLQVSDIIQLIYITKKSGVLKLIKSEEEEGYIYFKNGEVKHAVCQDAKTGESAFFTMFLWNTGNFDMLPFKDPPFETVQTASHYLMLEGMIKREEVNKKEVVHKTEDVHIRGIKFIDIDENEIIPHQLIVNEEDITDHMCVSANKDYFFIARFLEYTTIKLSRYVPFEEEDFILHVGPKLSLFRFSFHFPYYVVDGIEYTPIVYIDACRYESHLYRLDKTNYKVYNIEIYAPEDAQELKIFVGYMVLKFNMKRVGESNNYGISLHDFLEHIKAGIKIVGGDKCIETFHELLFESYISYKIRYQLKHLSSVELEPLILAIDKLDLGEEAKQKAKDIRGTIQSYIIYNKGKFGENKIPTL